jgi:formate C-acetyltransferase
MHYKFADGVQSIKSYPGNVPAIPDGSAASCPYGYSGPTWATPDGRRAGDPYHDGAISPMMGTDRNGPTAALKSISKIDPLRANDNFLLNQTFMPQFLRDEHKEVFADYLNTWGDLGIHHIQFSVVDRETLIDAQEHPEKHDHLIVRVCGYSAYFTDLSKGLQDAVIERTQQSFA